MKSKTGIILAIILLSILILALIVFLVNCLITGRSFTISWNVFRTDNTNVVLDETVPVEGITEINLSQNFGDIHIQKSVDDAIHIKAYGKSADELDWSISGNHLTIQSKQNNLHSFWRMTKNDFILSLPSSYAHKITVKADCGTCQVEDFANASFYIDCNAGNIEIGKAKNITATCDCGNIEIGEITNQCNLKVDAGNANVKKLDIQEDSSIKADMGNVTIEEISDIYIEAKVDLGNSNIRHNNRSSDITLTVDCDCGNITIGK